MPIDNTPAPPIQLTVTELRLLVKLGEQNDSNGQYGQRLGGLRTRVSLMGKLYTALDEVTGGADDSEEEGESDADRA